MIDKDLHIDAALSNISVMYKNSGFVADLVLPRITVAKRSDKIKVYDKTLFKAVSTYRRDKDASNVVDWGFATDGSYLCEKYAAKDYVSQDERDNADIPIRPDIDTTEIINSLLFLDREIRAKTLLTTYTNYTSGMYATLNAGQQWSAYDSIDSKPLVNIRDAKAAIYLATMIEPNVILIPYQVALTLADHPTIAAITKYTRDDLLTYGGLPPTLKGLKVIEAGAGYDTAQDPQTSVLAGVWSDFVWIGYVDPNPGLKTICFGVSPEWKGRIARKWHDNDKNADAIEIEEQGIDEVIIAKDCGYLLIDVLA